MKNQEEVKTDFKDTYGVLQLAAKPESSKSSNAPAIIQTGSLGCYSNWWKKFKAIFSLMPKKEERRRKSW